jgi:hypothetical protein
MLKPVDVMENVGSMLSKCTGSCSPGIADDNGNIDALDVTIGMHAMNFAPADESPVNRPVKQWFADRRPPPLPLALLLLL